MDYVIDSSDIQNKCMPVDTICVHVGKDLIKDDFFGFLYSVHNNSKQRVLEKMYNGFSKKVSFFTTDVNLDVAVVYRNNMVTNTIYHPGSKGFCYKYGLAYRPEGVSANSRTGIPVGEVDGVYARETYTIHKEHGLPGTKQSVLNYLKDNNLIEFSADVRAGITNYVTAEYTTQKDINIDIIHFIPKSIIVRNVSVYSKALDVVFTLKDVSNSIDPVRHPWSDKQINVDTFTKLKSIREPFAFTLNITNNENLNKDYYYKAGNQIVTVKSTTNELTPNGFHYRVISNDQIIYEQEGSIDELESIGVYDTKDACEYNGKPELKLGVEKLKNDIASIKHARDKAISDLELHQSKAELEVFKMKNEKAAVENRLKADNAKYDAEKTRFEEYKEKHRFAMEEIETGRKAANDKYNFEYTMMELKYEEKLLDLEHKQEIHKLVMQKTYLDAKVFLFKHNYEMKTGKKKFKQEKRNSDDKHTRDIEKLNVDIFGKFVSNTVGIVKSLLK